MSLKFLLLFTYLSLKLLIQSTSSSNAGETHENKPQNLKDKTPKTQKILKEKFLTTHGRIHHGIKIGPNQFQSEMTDSKLNRI